MTRNSGNSAEVGYPRTAWDWLTNSGNASRKPHKRMGRTQALNLLISSCACLWRAVFPHPCQPLQASSSGVRWIHTPPASTHGQPGLVRPNRYSKRNAGSWVRYRLVCLIKQDLKSSQLSNGIFESHFQPFVHNPPKFDHYDLMK